MTQYTQDDLSNDWEFKIVRSDTAAFRNPEALNELIEEEAQAGWVMLEKLDDSRIRFKRPRSARARDDFLPQGVDPYRTRYGGPFTGNTMRAGVAVGLGLLVALAAGGLLLARGSGVRIELGPISALIPLILIVFGLVLFFTRKLR